MSEFPENKQPPAAPERPQKKWALALDVVLDCLLFLLLQYLLSWVTLSFWTHPLRLLAIFIQVGIYAKFYRDMDKRLGKFWPGLVLSVVCVGAVILLVWLIGYFPISQTPVRLSWN